MAGNFWIAASFMLFWEKISCNQKKSVLVLLTSKKQKSKCMERDSYYEKRQEYGVTD